LVRVTEHEEVENGVADQALDCSPAELTPEARVINERVPVGSPADDTQAVPNIDNANVRLGRVAATGCGSSPSYSRGD
jgi:hypothetical protein